MHTLAESKHTGESPTIYDRIPLDVVSQGDVFDMARIEILPHIHPSMLRWYIGEKGRISDTEAQEKVLQMIDSDLTGHFERWPLLQLPQAEEVVRVVSHHPDAFPLGVTVEPYPLIDAHTVLHMQTGCREPMIAVGNTRFQEDMLLSVLQGILHAFASKSMQEIEVISIGPRSHYMQVRNRLTPERDALYDWKEYSDKETEVQTYIQDRVEASKPGYTSPLLLLIEDPGTMTPQVQKVRSLIAGAQHVDAVFFLLPKPETKYLLDAFPSNHIVFGEGSGFKPNGVDIFPGQFIVQKDTPGVFERYWMLHPSV